MEPDVQGGETTGIEGTGRQKECDEAGSVEKAAHQFQLLL